MDGPALSRGGPDPGRHMASHLRGRRVVLGVSGGIAAYKAVELCRRLVDAGAHVAPVLTEDATRFVGEVTFSALASEPVRRSLWDEAEPIPHTVLGQGADVVVVAPATARLLARYAAGLSDDLLTATLLATRAPVVLAPAMHTEMWEHPATADNVALLVRRGVRMVGPGVGRLAGGDVGPGRMAETEDILAATVAVLSGPGEQPLGGVRVLVSAGGTREAIDPVRFIGNRSSGKQGHAIAEEAAVRGAEVTLVTTTNRPSPASIRVVRVETAAEMAAAVLEHATAAQVVVMAAAVADFRPINAHPTKLAKSEGPPRIVLEPTPDILALLGRARRPGQVIVGFAAETVPDPRQLAERAGAKLALKGADLIVANDVSAPGVGFDHDTNAVSIFGAQGLVAEIPLSGKATVARAVLDAAAARLAR